MQQQQQRQHEQEDQRQGLEQANQITDELRQLEEMQQDFNSILLTQQDHIDGIDDALDDSGAKLCAGLCVFPCKPDTREHLATSTLGTSLRALCCPRQPLWVCSNTKNNTLGLKVCVRITKRRIVVFVLLDS